MSFMFPPTAPCLPQQCLNIPLPSLPLPHLSFAVCRTFVKVNQAPYLLVIDFLEDVAFEQAAVRVDAGKRQVTVKVPKVQQKAWPSLLFEGDKEAVAARREASSKEKEEFLKKVRRRVEQVASLADFREHELISSSSMPLSPAVSCSCFPPPAGPRPGK